MFSSRNIKPSWKGREAGMRWGCVSGGELGSVLLTGHGLHWVGVITHHPSSKPSLPGACSFQLFGQASLRGWEKGRHCPNFPNATNNSFSFKAFHPVLDSGRGRGDGGWEGRTAPLSHSPRFDSLYEHDPPIRNQGLISQLTASSSIISIQTN